MRDYSWKYTRKPKRGGNPTTTLKITLPRVMLLRLYAEAHRVGRTLEWVIQNKLEKKS